MRQVRLKAIYEANFTKCARTILDELKQDKAAYRGKLQRDECYMFVSKMGNQLFFVLSDGEVKIREGTPYERTTQVLDWRVWRIEHGEFEPRMLEDYARAVGLSFGIKPFKKWYQERKSA
jgi:hypothetical protein